MQMVYLQKNIYRKIGVFGGNIRPNESAIQTLVKSVK